MLGKFMPVDNPFGFDIREIYKDNKEIIRTKNLNMRGLINKDLPIFRCKKDFSNKEDFQRQFDGYTIERLNRKDIETGSLPKKTAPEQGLFVTKACFAGIFGREKAREFHKEGMVKLVNNMIDWSFFLSCYYS